ncbi:MAG: hypothetical protein K6L75_06730 [Cellvibrionaceae bacterium]
MKISFYLTIPFILLIGFTLTSSVIAKEAEKDNNDSIVSSPASDNSLESDLTCPDPSS